ncbi:Coiled-coil domain-containing protein 187 [Frankliniella fusca]|uniref:Coiled-coil domain-containing protein 187 n=1 Tax=Frankliniella fusca TaxID=407009 RepID=A0AAE1GW24_9NEOP|nr:Coiled-coil domain-containing protein 187 [Frankliniella fusca]
MKSGRGKGGHNNGSNDTTGGFEVQKQPQQFALVRWLTGDYCGTLTPNVPLDWIRDFNETDGEYDESYVVEWRKPPMPRTGWPIFDGQIIDVSDNENYLNEKMIKVKRSDEASGSDGQQSSSGSSTCSISSNAMLTSQSSQPSPDVLRELVANAVRQAINTTPRRPVVPESSCALDSTAGASNKVLVGKKLLMSRTAFNKAKNAASPGRMIGVCLRQAFSVKRLQRSTYAGQGRKKEDGTVHSKPMLKKYQKMVDLQNFVLERFPHLTQSSFSTAVNSFTGSRLNKKPQIQYVSESESEEEEES